MQKYISERNRHIVLETKWNPDTGHQNSIQHPHDAAGISTFWEIIIKITKGFLENSRKQNNYKTIYNLARHKREDMVLGPLPNFIQSNERKQKLMEKLGKNTYYTYT